MHQPQASRPVRRRRFAAWLVLGAILILASFLGSNQVWAQSVICSDNFSIPIDPTLLDLLRSGSASYQVSLCTTPTAPVEVTVLPDPANKLVIAPPVLTFTSTAPQTVTLTISSTVPLGEAFTVELEHSASSDDPDYNWGTVNMPVVTVRHAIGNIGGVVFNDLNHNLLPDPGEPRFQGANLALAGGGAAQTDVDGIYAFLELVPATYTVTLTTPAGYYSVLPTAQSAAVTVGANSVVNYPLNPNPRLLLPIVEYFPQSAMLRQP